jgi:hypothetical protein
MKIEPTDDQELRLIRAVDKLRQDPEWAPLMAAAATRGNSKAASGLLMSTTAHVVFELGLRSVESAAAAEKGARQ